MANLVDIGKFQKSITDLEASLEKIKTGMESIEKEIDVLSTKEAQLIRKIKYMKKEDTVALASEFGNVKLELARVKNRLSIVRVDRENFRTAHVKAEADLEKAKDGLVDAIRAPKDNVVYGPFRR
jgi:chromosome segregation ATPase